MNGNISIDPRATVECGENMYAVGETYNNEVKRIYEIVDDLKIAWTGTSAEKYTKDIEAFREDYEKLGQLILHNADVFKDAGNKYIKLEETL